MLLSVLVGVAWGIAGKSVSDRLINLCPIAMIGSLATLLIAWFRTDRGGPAAEQRAAWAGGLTCYTAILLADSAFWVGTLDHITIHLDLLVPMVAGICFLVRLRDWLAVAGDSLLLTASVALLIHHGTI